MKQKPCRKCGSPIPLFVKIGETTKRLTSRHYCLECSPYGTGNNRNLDRTCKMCPKCQEEKSLDNFYVRGKLYHPYCKPCMLVYNKDYRRGIKSAAIAYKGGKCLRCGYNKCQAALDFHHLIPEHKDVNIAHSKRTFDKLRPELDKCILLCSNCHRELHDGFWQP